MKIKLKKIFFLFIFCGLSILLAFCLLEVFLRIFYPQPLSPAIYENDPILGFKYKSNCKGFLNGKDFKHIEFSINSKGLRDEEYSYYKQHHTYRILIVGDSFTAGHGVEKEDSYPEVLERLLNEAQEGFIFHNSWLLEKSAKAQMQMNTRQNGSTIKFEVINAGVGAWSTSQELLWLEQEGLKYHPDLVILGFYQNDFWGNVESRLFTLKNNKLLKMVIKKPSSESKLRTIVRLIPYYPYLTQHSHLINFLKRKMISYLLNKQGQKALEEISLHKNDSLKSLNTKLKHYSLKLTFALIQRMREMINERMIDFIVVVIPPYGG